MTLLWSPHDLAVISLCSPFDLAQADILGSSSDLPRPRPILILFEHAHLQHSKQMLIDRYQVVVSSGKQCSSKQILIDRYQVVVSSGE